MNTVSYSDLSMTSNPEEVKTPESDVCKEENAGGVLGGSYGGGVLRVLRKRSEEGGGGKINQ